MASATTTNNNNNHSNTTAPKLKYVETSETTISVEFAPIDATTAYRLQWKLHHLKWDNTDAVHQIELSPGTTKTQAIDLEPGTTYCIRLIRRDGAQEPGPELILDTEQVGCTPKTNQSCCTIQ